NGENGWLVAPGDASSLAGGIRGAGGGAARLAHHRLAGPAHGGGGVLGGVGGGRAGWAVRGTLGQNWAPPWPKRSTTALGLGLALLMAAMLRFWALGSGLPFSPGVDEPEIMERAVRMIKTGDFNPHFFDYPALYMYLEAAASTLRFLAGAMEGRWAA